MSMPIQRQSESFGYFDEGPRFARDRTATDLPSGLAGLINTSGPRITGGLLNTRQAGEKILPWTAGDWEGAEQFSGSLPEDEYRDHPDSWSHQPTEQDYADWEARHKRRAKTAVSVDGLDPDEHAYHTEDPYGPGPGRDWNPDYGYEPSDRDEMRAEGVVEDDDSGYNWGPDPSGHLHPADVYHSPSAEPFDAPVYRPRSSPYDEHTGSRHPFDRTAACQSCGGEVYHISGEGFVHDDTDDHNGWDIDEHHQAEPDEDDDRNLGLSSVEGWHDREARRVALAPAPQDPALAPQVPVGGGFRPAHRVGLPWRDQVIPGTVIGLDGPQVAVRWDDGQYSSEEPHSIHLL
jgi:hypothetical protein